MYLDVKVRLSAVSATTVRRMECDYKPMIGRRRLDFVAVSGCRAFARTQLAGIFSSAPQPEIRPVNYKRVYRDQSKGPGIGIGDSSQKSSFASTAR